MVCCLKGVTIKFYSFIHSYNYTCDDSQSRSGMQLPFKVNARATVQPLARSVLQDNISERDRDYRHRVGEARVRCSQRLETYVTTKCKT